MENNKEKIFVSYTEKDVEWALWIAEELEKNEIEVIIKAWDFKPGDNFVEKMDEALLTSSIVVAVLSKAYIESYHCKAEQTAAYAKKNQRLIPIRIENFEVEGLWASINYIDLVDKNQEEACMLLDRIFNNPERKSKGYPGGKVSGGSLPQNDLPNTNSTSLSGMPVPDERSPAFSGITCMVGMPSNNLPERNNKFTGREVILDSIHKAFQTKNEVSLIQPRAIIGMGGIGKTETAREYAYLYHNEYLHIWWVNAETGTSIEEAYRAFAVRNKLGTPEDKSETVIANVKNWMLINKRWLFIFDNVADEESLKKYCASSSSEGQHVLITSRNRQLQQFEIIDIDVFTEEEACNFIEKYTKRTADEYFKELAYKMGYLPLALDQAGAYMYIHQKSYKDYLALYNKKNLALLSKYKHDADKKTITTTWQISFDKVVNPAAKQCLNLFAFFAPENIFLLWFQKANEVLPDDLRKAVSDEMDYDDTIAEITKYSLVRKNEKGVLSIHRLMQDVIRDNIGQEQSKWRNYCVNILNELVYFEFHTAESRAFFILLAPHIDSVTQEIKDEEATEEVARLYSFLGQGFDELADYPQSLKYYIKSLTINEKVLGAEHPSTATFNNNIGLVYHKQGNYDLALEYYGKALAIREKVLDAEHPSTATSYNNIGLVYSTQGNYDLALEYYGKALAIREKVLGKEHPNTALTYNNIALVYHSQSNYDVALKYCEKALAILEKVLGKEHPNTATTYNNMGMVYDSQGNYDLALEYYGKALSICEKVLGKEHPYTAATYHNIAGVYRELDNYDLALEYYEEALAIFEKVLGSEHPDTKTTINNMTYTYEASGKPEPFKEWMRKKRNLEY